MSKMLVLALGFVVMAGVSQSEDKAKAPAPLPPSKLTAVVTDEFVEVLRPVYTLTVDEKSTSARRTRMTIKEAKRDPKTSVVEIQSTSGSALGTSISIWAALSRIAEDRGTKYWMLLKEDHSEEIGKMLVGFSDTKVEDPATYFEVKGILKEDLAWCGPGLGQVSEVPAKKTGK